MVFVHEGDVLEGHAFLGLVELGHPVALLRRAPEIGVGHAEGLEDPRLQEVLVGGAGDAADQEAQDIRGVAVVETLAGGVGQGQPSQPLQPHVRPVRVAQGRAQHVLIGVGDGPHRSEAVGQARAVGQKVLHRDVAGGVDHLVQRPGGRLQHLHAREFRRPLGDRVVQLQPALLHQHEGQDRGQGLGHGGDAEHRVPGHGLVGGDVALAQGVELDDLALAPDQGDEARQVAGLHHTLQGAGDPVDEVHVHGRPPAGRSALLTLERVVPSGVRSVKRGVASGPEAG